MDRVMKKIKFLKHQVKLLIKNQLVYWFEIDYEKILVNPSRMLPLAACYIKLYMSKGWNSVG